MDDQTEKLDKPIGPEPSPQERLTSLTAFYKEAYNLSPLFGIPETYAESREEDLSLRSLVHLGLVEDIKRRGNSELLEKLKARLTELIEPANITSAMKEHIIFLFETTWPWGRRTDEEVESFIPEWMKEIVPQSGGIFSPDKKVTKQIEKSTYRGLLQASLKVHQELFESAREAQRAVESILGPDAWDPFENPEEHLIEKWKLEFMNRYGEEL